MKLNTKVKTIILITFGILFALSLIINNSLNFNGGSSDRSSGNSVEFIFDKPHKFYMYLLMLLRSPFWHYQEFQNQP